MVNLIVWDLDGTLVNSLPTTIQAFSTGMEPFLGRLLTVEEFKSHMGASEEQMIRKIVGDEKAQACIKHVRKTMQRNMNRITLFEGIAETLSHFKEKLPMAIFTGRGHYGTQSILNHLQIGKHFDFIVTSDDVANHKPHPEGLFKICEQFKVDPINTVMIGDSPLDILAGKKAGVKTIACTWSSVLGERDKLISAQPDYQAAHPLEIHSFIER